MAISTAPGRATVIGTGLIGGPSPSPCGRGWHVSGTDVDPAAEQRARDLGVIGAMGIDPASDLTFVAAPVRAIADEVRRALAETTGVVTDVGSVKSSLVQQVDDPRFVAGHPMAGSEQLGLEGSTADMFAGALWVLTPVAHTDAEGFALVRGVVRSSVPMSSSCRPSATTPWSRWSPTCRT